MLSASDRQRYQIMRRRNRDLVRLCRLTAEVAKLSEERATLKKIVDTAAALTGVGGAHIVLVDRLGRSLYGVISSGRHRLDAPRLRFAMSESAAARAALKSRRPVAIARASRDPRVNRAALDRLSIGAIAYIPLRSAAQSFGLLILVRSGPHRWTREELDLGIHLADTSSVAIENARLLSQLAETEGRLRSLVEHIPAITYSCEVHPPYGTFFISPQTQSMLGYSPRVWLEENDFFMKIVHPEDVQRLIDLTEEAVRDRGFATTEYRLLDRQGDVRWFRDEAVLVRDPSGNPVAWHGVLVEITGLKRMQHQGMSALPAPERGRRPGKTDPPPA
jgi:PAS domain S-box-containing protein